MESISIVQWEQALGCTEDGNPLNTKSTANIYKKSIFHNYDDQRLVGEDFEDVKKYDLGLNAAGSGLKTCNADLVVELYA